jgi:hypothetical protein
MKSNLRISRFKFVTGLLHENGLQYVENHKCNKCNKCNSILTNFILFYNG